MRNHILSHNERCRCIHLPLKTNSHPIPTLRKRLVGIVPQLLFPIPLKLPNDFLTTSCFFGQQHNQPYPLTQSDSPARIHPRISLTYPFWASGYPSLSLLIVTRGGEVRAPPAPRRGNASAAPGGDRAVAAPRVARGGGALPPNPSSILPQSGHHLSGHAAIVGDSPPTVRLCSMPPLEASPHRPAASPPMCRAPRVIPHPPAAAMKLSRWGRFASTSESFIDSSH